MVAPGDEQELLRDPVALAELRERYRGRTDLVDLLRWRADPAALGSDGSRSPVARAGDLGPLIYGRADSRESALRRDAAAAEAESLLAMWAADSAALEAALRAPAAEKPAVARPRRGAGDRRRLALLLGAAAVAVAVLVGVGALLQPHAAVETAASPSSTPLPTATPTPKPTRTAVPASPVPPPVDVAPTTPPEEVDLRPDYFDNDIVSVLQVPINGGPIDNANGVADVDDYGVPLSYVVANGDVFELIAKRFDLGTTYLASINAVRRENPTELFVGDTINLGATTILRIGDQNGVVYNYPERMPEPHLPQD
ncbi:MAG: hypothetical protein JWR04_1734 [Rhodoglobus sp.]|nr:hypothetical protein [Rhodoglobus sp.]